MTANFHLSFETDSFLPLKIMLKMLLMQEKELYKIKPTSQVKEHLIWKCVSQQIKLLLTIEETNDFV
ncbi:MAG: hypothetical protein J0M03_12325 [Acidobacteria bacterium]|nr:hypothetical protein [Acidobacteriota bacterium]